jgi:predicted dehydrogenase
MPETVRVGIIGAGKIAQARHIPLLQKVDDVEVTHAWSRTPETARKAASEFGIPTVVGQWQKIVESPDIDAVVIGTPPNMHLPVTLAALDAGKHVLCQGRMARNLAEAQEMLRAARAVSLVTALYPPRPGLKGDRVVQRLLHEEDYVGEIREVRVNGMAFTEESEGYQWQVDPDIVGVNAMTVGLWAEVLDRWVGPATSVVAKGKTHGGRRATASGGRAEGVVPDSLAVAAELECGATATYHYSTQAAFAPDQSIEIYGSRGGLVYRMFSDELSGVSEGSEELAPIEIPPGDVRLQDTDAEFVSAIREGTPVSPDFEDGVRYMGFCEAVALSLKTGEAVQVPPPPVMDAWGRYLESEESS